MLALWLSASHVSEVLFHSPACFHTQLALTVINIERNFIKSPFDMPQDQRQVASALWADHAQRPRLLPLPVWTQGMT